MSEITAHFLAQALLGAGHEIALRQPPLWATYKISAQRWPKLNNPTQELTWSQSEFGFLELPYDLSDALLADLRQRLNAAVVGKAMSDVGQDLEAILAHFGKNERTSTALIISNLIEMAIERPEEKVVLVGTANLARSNSESSAEIHGVLEALEEQVVLLKLLSDAGDTMRVRIGAEQSESGLQRTSLVSMGYGVDGNSLGALGILGPTRMDYSSSMSAVNAVARYVGRFLMDNQ